MEIVLIIGAVLLIVLCAILFAGRALGDPQRKFDEAPADVYQLDSDAEISTSDWNIHIPSRMTPEEQEIVTAQFERLSAHLNSERRP